MTDRCDRVIDYLRVSVTDRCNLRCVYCMPRQGVRWLPHDDILSYEELVRLCRIFAGLGIGKIRLTGGEALVRKGVSGLVRELKAIPDIERVNLTTNGLLLAQQLDALVSAGLDGVNVSLDAVDEERFRSITRFGGAARVTEGIERALSCPQLSVKVNCVPLGANDDQLVKIAAMARDRALAVRFIELMPIGLGRSLTYHGEGEVRALLEEAFGPMTPYPFSLGNGPCRYFSLPGFVGKIGFISAMSHRFCHSCNRVRLTAQGFLKPCLQYRLGADLRALLRQGADDDELGAAIRQAVLSKPDGHRFLCDEGGPELEQHIMSQIGG